MKIAALFLAAMFALPTPARALECDQLSGGLGICLPRYGTDFDQWATADINALTLINSSAAVTGSTTTAVTFGQIAVRKITGMASGPAGIEISSATTQTSSATITGGGGLGVTYGVSAASASITGSVTASSFTALGALGFKGEGSALTAITAANISAGTAGISVTGNAATVTTNANLTGPITSVGNATTIVGPVPTAAVDLSTVTAALALKANLAGATFTGASGITNQAFTATGANGNVVSAASVTASGFFGNGSAMTALTAANISAGTLGASVIASSIAVNSAGTLQIAADAVTTANILDGAVNTGKLAADSVTTGKILDGTIIGPDIALSTIPIRALNASGLTAGQGFRRNSGGTDWEAFTAGTGAGDAILSATQTFSGANTFTSSVTIASVGYLDVRQGAVCTGISCRVAYSSGTASSFSFVLQSSVTYTWLFSMAHSSGTGTATHTAQCTVNGNTTGSNYFQSETSYPNARTTNNQGATGHWRLNNHSGGVQENNDFANRTTTFSTALRMNRLIYTGTMSSSEGTQSGLEHYHSGGLFKGASPWTVTCVLVTAGYGWFFESILYQVGN